MRVLLDVDHLQLPQAVCMIIAAYHVILAIFLEDV